MTDEKLEFANDLKSRIAKLEFREVSKMENEQKMIGFHHGALSDKYEIQANEQGYTLGDDAELFDKIGYAYNLLRIHGYLTDSQADMVCKKIQKNLAKTVRKLN